MSYVNFAFNQRGFHLFTDEGGNRLYGRFVTRSTDGKHCLLLFDESEQKRYRKLVHELASNEKTFKAFESPFLKRLVAHGSDRLKYYKIITYWKEDLDKKVKRR